MELSEVPLGKYLVMDSNGKILAWYETEREAFAAATSGQTIIMPPIYYDADGIASTKTPE